MKFTHMHNFNRTFQYFQKIITSNVEKLIVFMFLIVEMKIFEFESIYKYIEHFL